MTYKSRLNRFEERRQQMRIFWAFFGTVALIAIIAIFGVRILIAFSVSVDKLRGTGPKITEQIILLPPEFDTLPEATNSAITWVTGRAQPKMVVHLFVNDSEPKKVTVGEDGLFKVEKITLKNGVNTISGKTTDEKNATSELSDVIKIVYKKAKPTLSVTSPGDGETITGDKAVVTINGQTEESNALTINDRFVVVKGDGSFSYDFNLKEGEQTVKLVAKDIAGNETILERKINYKK